MIERMKDDKSWSSYPNNVDRKKDRMRFSTKNKQIMFGEIFRKTVGFGGENNRRWGWWCSPEYIAKITGFSRTAVRVLFRELEQRKVMTYNPNRWWAEKNRTNGWVEINPNIDEWLEDY